MSTAIKTKSIVRFYEVPTGKEFDYEGKTYLKISKTAGQNGGAPVIFNSQRLVLLDTGTLDERPWDELDIHTHDFTPNQLAGVVEAIVERAVRDYSHRINIDANRLRKGIYCAHRAKPIRLIALLNTCMLDFPTDVIQGIYRHYDPATDTMRGGWTAQHAEPHRNWWE